MANKVTFDYSKAAGFVQEHEMAYMSELVAQAKEKLVAKSGAGNDFLGWIDLPVDYDKEEFVRIQKAAEKIRKDSEVLLVIGIGGSYLGARAAIEFLGHSFANVVSKEIRKSPEIYYVGNSISSTYIKHLIDVVGDRDFSINMISKSGTTTEPAIAFRVFKEILEKKYGLHPAERKERAERPELKKVDYAAGDVKHQIGNTVKAACYGYRFQSFGEYKALLAAYNVCAEEVKGEVNGKPYQGIVYSAMNDKGEKAGNPVKASRIGKSVGYVAVQRRMEKSGEAIRNGKLKERTRKIVATAMQTTRSRKELEQQLKKQGIDVVFRQNDSGRIYGVTFIDHDSRVVLNGSRLGKEYSANVFNERFSGETGKMHQPEVSAPQQDQPTHQEQPGFMPKSDIVPGVASVLGAFGGLLGGGASGGDDPQDTARQKRKKKKKRTRRID